MIERTIQDIDVEHAEEVTMEIVTNTCKEFNDHSHGNDDHLTATAKALSFEL